MSDNNRIYKIGTITNIKTYGYDRNVACFILYEDYNCDRLLKRNFDIFESVIKQMNLDRGDDINTRLFIYPEFLQERSIKKIINDDVIITDHCIYLMDTKSFRRKEKFTELGL